LYTFLAGAAEIISAPHTLNIAVSRSRRYAAVTNNGWAKQTIQLLDAKNDRELDNVVVSKA